VSAAPLEGRVVLLTGVSRRAGIAFGIARRLLADGAQLLVAGWSAHDEAQPWGADPAGGDALLAALDGGTRVHRVDADLVDAAAPAALAAAAVERFGGLDAVVAAHARSSSFTLAEVTAEELDRTWAVNARASLLLVQALAAHHEPARGGGRAVLFTSGQHLGPMAGELPYAVSKGAIHQMTRSLADAVAGQGITVNAVNPGPVDTGYAPPDVHARVAAAFPGGRWGRPEDIAPVVAWLLSGESAWLTGQVLDVEGGFRRGG
jgi:NAD(P)-dependent dehydrogenase (short-subunit alcohol dehydrogenase family)